MAYYRDPTPLHILTIVVEVFTWLKNVSWLIAVIIVLRLMGRSGDVAELVIVALGGLRIIGAVIKYATVRYAIDAQNFIISSGVLEKQLRTIPLSRIQNVNIKRGLIHRMIGVAELRIETASGAGAEAELSVVSLLEAETLRQQLLATVSIAQTVAVGPMNANDAVSIGAATAPSSADGQGHRSGELAGAMVGAAPVAARTLYEASAGRLLLSGATTLRIGTVIGLIFGVFFFIRGDESEASAVRQLVSFLERNGLTGAWGILAITAAIILAGWLVSIGWSLVSLWDFRLEQTGKRLQRQHGLLTQVQSSFSAARIQVLRVSAPPLHRLLGIWRLSAVTAGSFAEQQDASSSVVAPVVRREEISPLLDRLLPGLSLEGIAWRAVSRRAIRRAFVRYSFWLTVLIGLLAWRWDRTVAWGLPGALATGLGFGILYWRALRYAITDEALYVRSGIFLRRFEVIPRDKVQAVLVSANPIQRRIGLARLEVVTAGSGFGASADIPDLDAQDAIELQEALSRRAGEMPDPLILKA
jgi:putative membrane protein